VRRLAFSLLSAFLLVAWPAAADEGHANHGGAGEQLGTVSFPISCAPAVQAPFNRGVALLHSFWYEEAEKQFEEITRKDPQCAMAHWGVAMSLYHQLWDHPSESSLKRGWEEMRKAETLSAKTERERGYIAALTSFYRDHDKSDHWVRAGAYSQAMDKVNGENPKDLEAGAFYALSLLASQRPDDTSLANPKKAVGILNQLFRQQPDHPGLAHYIIHSCDRPQLASMGLEAARRYAAIAPTAAHAVHMPSHIFARLGLWQEDVQSNLKSVEATHRADAMHMGGSGHQLHAMHFLIYAYLQTGQDAAARQRVDEAKNIVAQLRAAPNPEDASMSRYYDYALAHFPALYALETRDWSAAAALEPPAQAEPLYQAISYWARTIGTAHLGDVAGARQNATQFRALEEATRKSKYAYELEGPDFARDEVEAWVDFAEQKHDEALRRMRAAADLQDKVGKTEEDIPAREMLAGMLLKLDRPEEALAEYEASLKTDPNRFNGLYGAAHAAELAHQADKAAAYYAQLLKNCPDSQRPELSQARTALQKLGAGGQ
jgi:tetratricopeptide (TPR) repeat protein